MDQVDIDFLLTVITTAGLDWYQNSVAVFDEDEDFFIIKLRWPEEYVVLDLKNRKISKKPSHETFQDVLKALENQALYLLDSKDPYQRQTGAMICNELRVSESIPRLKELLKDQEFYTTYSYSDDGDMEEAIIELYVRKAAKDALISLGEKVEDVIIELPEKECLKFGKEGRYIIDWEKCGQMTF